MSKVTCQTEGCANAGHEIEVPTVVPDEDGNDVPIDAVFCGVCGNPIDYVAAK